MSVLTRDRLNFDVVDGGGLGGASRTLPTFYPICWDRQGNVVLPGGQYFGEYLISAGVTQSNGVVSISFLRTQNTRIIDTNAAV